MHEALFRSIITSLAIFAVLTACAESPRIVPTKSGGTITLPACKDYVSKFSGVSIRADILNKYQGELKLTAESRAILDTLQQDYGMQAMQLCGNAPMYISAGNEAQYFCRDERLSNSLVQLRMLNSAIESIHTIGEAKNQAESITKLADDFIKRFITQFDKPCSEPPKPLSPQEIRSELGSTPFPRTVELSVGRPVAAFATVSVVAGDYASVRCNQRDPLSLPLWSGTVVGLPAPV